MPPVFDLQGHRGARGLRPENTFPSFEAALDAGASSIETDLHLTADGIPVILHDPTINGKTCRLAPGADAPDPALQPPVASLTLEQLRGYRADRNPDRRRFPEQRAVVTPLARLFAHRQGREPYGVPTLVDLFAFVEAYAGELGVLAGKSAEQRERARYVVFDLELKRIPYRPGQVGDRFSGKGPGRLERSALKAARAAGVLDRTRVRSFDHRSVRALLGLEPRLTGAVLVAHTAPVSPAALARQAGATVYCPDLEFLDRAQLREAQAEGIRVIPWTVNDPDDWARLLDWGVDGITTDYPDRLAAFLRGRGVAF